MGKGIVMIRRYKLGDEQELMTIFQSSIRENAKKYYSEDQLISWAPGTIDLVKWRERMEGINPYVLVENESIMGYADLQDSGYIDHFFVRGGQAGKGIGRQLMTYILEEAKTKQIKELTSDVSLAAQGFFKKFGFEIVERKTVNIRGVELENALMKKKMI